jgi:hypothetical protein
MSRSLAIVLLLIFSESVAWGYRPFIATDAAVADPKAMEIELGYFTLEREEKTLSSFQRSCSTTGLQICAPCRPDFSNRRLNLDFPILPGLLRHGWALYGSYVSSYEDGKHKC